MCLTNRQTTDLPESVEAFKVFAEVEGVLYSAFLPAFRKKFKYPLGTKLTVNPPDAVFYAFRSVYDAHEFRTEAVSPPHCQVDIYDYFWDVAQKCSFVVHPVTLTNLVAIGEFVRLHYNGCWPAVEAREIVVHPKSGLFFP